MREDVMSQRKILRLRRSDEQDWFISFEQHESAAVKVGVPLCVVDAGRAVPVNGPYSSTTRARLEDALSRMLALGLIGVEDTIAYDTDRPAVKIESGKVTFLPRR